MRFSKNLYLGSNVKHPSRQKYRLRIRRPNPNLYILRLAQVETDSVEILRGTYYLQPYAYREKNYIVGMASSKEEALQLITSMLQNCVEDTKGVDLRRYLIEKSHK